MGTVALSGNSSRFASPQDYEICREYHRRFGTTYYFATQLFPRRYRERVHALYGFVRVPDEWVDNPQNTTVEQQAQALRAYEEELLAGLAGICPTEPVLRAFVDVMRETGMPADEPTCFLRAMEMDLTRTRYQTYAELEDYMRGSAAAVGLMMCHAIGTPLSEPVRSGAMALGNAMQLTNFTRDVAEDARRNRIYLPLEDLEQFRVTPSEIERGEMSDRVEALVRFQIARARALYAEADRAIPLLPFFAQRPVKLARLLYSRILDKIEAQDCNVFAGRARTTRSEKMLAAARVLVRGVHA